MHRLRVLPIGSGCLLGLLVLCSSGIFFRANAMPPYPGDSAHAITPGLSAGVDLYSQMSASFAARGIDQPDGGLATGIRRVGNFNILAICVDFPDKPASVPALEFDTLIFGDVPGSVRDFYHEITYRTLTITTVNLPSSLGWHHLDSSYSSYVNADYGMGIYPHNTQKLCEDLVDKVDSCVNFADYDNDGDKFVDGVIIVHPGRGAEFTFSTNDIWSHKWGIMPRLRDGVYVSSFTIQPEFWNRPGDITIGVFAHEIGHLLGLPDLYDLDGSSRGVGKWSLMASGAWNGRLGNSPAHLDAWCKSQLGIIMPLDVTASLSGAIVPATEPQGFAYRLPIDGTGGREYFLVENRQKLGYDSALPGSGLLIWRIDESRMSNMSEWYPGHTTNGNYLVALEQADNLWQMEKNINLGDSTDPYPGPASTATFSAPTSPSSNAYSGAPSYVTVTNISASALSMSCDLTVPLVTDVFDDIAPGSIRYALDLTNMPNPFNPSTVIRFVTDGRKWVTVSVYDILGRLVNTLFSGNADSGTHELVWNGDNKSGQPLASGVYFARMSSGAQTLSHKMLLVR
ncbi:MAG: M6 family metalloprotease domain-containing protein [candidate division Zixibacteria bacterium]|nr:M6 family metalloprotease domain-containing protein [candidate division Zixibacteria bacterium]